MFLGSKLIVYTDHKNLTHHMMQLTTQCALHWRLLLEEFNPKFEYLMGESNIIVDTCSY